MQRFEDAAQRIIDQLPAQAEEGQASDNGRRRPWYEGLEGSLRPLDGERLGSSGGELLHREASEEELSDRIFEPLDDDSFDKVGGRVFEDGIDALAFYKSYHFLMSHPFPGSWGIFLLDVGIRYIADEIQQAHPTKFRREVALRIARRFLHRHERFHFRADAWAFSMEAVTKQPLYAQYLSNVYLRLAPGVECVEESLANSHAFESLRRLRLGVDAWMKDFMSAQPGAYANFRFSQVGGRELAAATLATQIMFGAAWRAQTVDDCLFHAPFIGQGNYLSDDVHCPVWEVRISNVAQLLAPLLRLPDRNEFRDFVVRYLDGQLRDRSDHEKFQIDNGRVVRIPNRHRGKDRLMLWELKGTLQQAGMQNWEYSEERRRTDIWTTDVPRSEVKPPLPGSQ